MRNDYGEKRWRGLGLIGGTVQVVSSEHEAETIRIISLRKATKREHKEFEKAVQNKLEAG